MSYRTDSQLATDNTNISTLGGVDATKIEKVELQGLVTNLIDSKRNKRDSERQWIDVTNNNIANMVSGGADNKAALQTLFDYLIDNGGGTLYFPIGKYDLDGALADTGNANAQVYFKQVNLNQQQVSITLQGARKPPNQLFTSSPIPNGTHYSIIRSTLTGASGQACCIGSQRQSDGGLAEQNNVCVNVFDMIFEAPPNPTFTMLDFRCTQSGTFDGILVNAGNVNYPTVVEPGFGDSVGIKFPDFNHTPGTIVGSIDVWGFYRGVRLGELVIANAIRCWSCQVGLWVAGSFHGCVINNYIALQCPIGIQALGAAVLQINYYDIEDANGTGQTWQNSNWYLDDEANNLTGRITWDTVNAGVGRVNVFKQNGGAKMVVNKVGTMAMARYTPTSSTDNTYALKDTICADDTNLYFRTSTGTWKKIPWQTF